ncbi:MAG: cyclic nucleotide-binding domain-containing protein [Myxococcota bacterium]
MARDPKKVKDEAQKAVERGRWKAAAGLYLELADLDAADPQWPQRAGDMLRRIDRLPEAATALRRAADGYAHKGFVLKAIAVCRQILEIDANDIDAKERLTRLAVGRVATGPVPPGIGKAPTRAQPARAAPKTPTIPPGQLIAAAPLGQVFASTATRPEGMKGQVHDIPLEEADIDAAFSRIEKPGERPAPPLRAPSRSERLVSALDPASLHWLVARLQARKFGIGEVILRPEDAGAALHLILSGAVVVRQDGRELERIAEGGFFGEVALVTDLPRHATVLATDETDILSVPRDALAELIDRQPNVLRTLLGLLRDRLLERLIRTSPIFTAFPEAERRAVEQSFRFVEAERGAFLITEGERSPGLFVLVAGRVEVVTQQQGMTVVHLSDLGPGELFGEISLLTGGSAVASIRALKKCWTLLLPRDAFQRLVVEHPDVLIYLNDLAEKRQRARAQAVGEPFREGQLELA